MIRIRARPQALCPARTRSPHLSYHSSAMQLWFAHTGAVRLREQLVTQIILAILSDDLSPGQRLPSTRELARRFRVHPNTISAGCRQLERERWVEFRRGSGVFVRGQKPEAPPSPALAPSRANSSSPPSQHRGRGRDWRKRPGHTGGKLRQRQPHARRLCCSWGRNRCADRRFPFLHGEVVYENP